MFPRRGIIEDFLPVLLVVLTKFLKTLARYSVVWKSVVVFSPSAAAALVVGVFFLMSTDWAFFVFENAPWIVYL